MNSLQYQPIIDQALREDLALAGDLSTDLFIAKDIETTAEIVARSNGVLAGIDMAKAVFQTLNSNLVFSNTIKDGQRIEAGQTVASISGQVRSILSAERTALNLLSHLCGIASATAEMVEKIEGTKAKLTDTRKTLPGLRSLQKYAVTCGGGVNHRFTLSDSIMLKDNHLAATKDWKEKIIELKNRIGHTVKIEVEVDTLEQLKVLLDLPVDIVLLDNMSCDQLRKAVQMIDGKMISEASGGITLETVREIAMTGVDYISCGALTHSVKALDLGLDMKLAF